LPIFQVLLLAFQLLGRADDAKCLVVLVDVADANRVDDLERQALRRIVGQFRRTVVDVEGVGGDLLELPGADMGLHVERVRAAIENVAGLAGAVGAPVDVGRAYRLIDVPPSDEELARRRRRPPPGHARRGREALPQLLDLAVAVEQLVGRRQAQLRLLSLLVGELARALGLLTLLVSDLARAFGLLPLRLSLLALRLRLPARVLGLRALPLRLFRCLLRLELLRLCDKSEEPGTNRQGEKHQRRRRVSR
jgi:hypothetical protein